MNRRRSAERAGRRAETLASWYLRAKGYRVRARGFRVTGGEIDIVAQRGRVLAFVEVKARANRAVALEAVNARQRRRIAAAAGVYLSRHRDTAALMARFDVIVVVPWRRPYHIMGAWEQEPVRH